MTKIIRLHHSAYRCKDSEKTRIFYEDFLGMPLVKTLKIENSKTKRKITVLHTFYQMFDGSHIAFFEEPLEYFEFKSQRDYDLHIALEVEENTLEYMYKKGINSNVSTRGIVDHGFIKSIYLRDPNGYVVELTTKTSMGKNKKTETSAHHTLKKWQKSKPRSVY